MVVLLCAAIVEDNERALDPRRTSPLSRCGRRNDARADGDAVGPVRGPCGLRADRHRAQYLISLEHPLMRGLPCALRS